MGLWSAAAKRLSTQDSALRTEEGVESTNHEEISLPDPRADFSDHDHARAKAGLGDQVTFNIHTLDHTHGFAVTDPDGFVLVPSLTLASTDGTAVRSFTVRKMGTYTYACTFTTCSPGHSAMMGTFDVGMPTDPGRGY
jgi:plastocyanin